MSALTLKRTNSDDADFRKLVVLLDNYLAVVDGEDHNFYNQFNKVDAIKEVVVMYQNENPIACGAIKAFSRTAAEVKRMFVRPDYRKQGIAAQILADLESWAKSIGYAECLLETGKKQVEAIGLYLKLGYNIIPNYGQYAGIENSVCMSKSLLKPNA